MQRFTFMSLAYRERSSTGYCAMQIDKKLDIKSLLERLSFTLNKETETWKPITYPSSHTQVTFYLNVNTYIYIYIYIYICYVLVLLCLNNNIYY